MTENTATAARFVAAEAAYTDPQTGATDRTWGVHDTQESLFAPFGGGEELAKFAAQRVTEMPYLPWSFVSTFVLVEQPGPSRFEWTEAIYTEADGSSATAYGAVDNELGRFYPFSDDRHDPDAVGFVASVEAAPEGKYRYAAAYTKTN